VPQAGTCWASYNPNFTGPVKINGGWGHGNVNTDAYIDKNAFISPASFTYGNTPATAAYGLRNPHFANQDLSVSRYFPVRSDFAGIATCVSCARASFIFAMSARSSQEKPESADFTALSSR